MRPRPGVVSEFPGMWHGVKRPHQFSRHDVVRAQVSGRRKVCFAGRRSEDQKILEDLARRIRLNAADFLGITSEVFAQIDDAVLTERHDRLAGRGINFLKVVTDAEKKPAILAVLALPVIHAAAGDSLQAFMNPDLFARSGIERHERTVAPFSVNHSARDNRVEHRLAILVSPRHLEPRNV